VSPRREIKNLAASIRAKLGEVARRRGVELQLVLSEYAIERFLHRLGASPQADRFVVKGATLFRIWSGDERRATWDLDLLGREVSGVGGVVTAMHEICSVVGEDGLEFLRGSVKGEEIRAPDEYAGVRVRIDVRLGNARIPVQVDVGFGDAVIPAPTREAIPTVLDLALDPPNVFVYPREAVVAEKFEAMVVLGMTNSRMKDFYDVHRLAALSTFRGSTLFRAVKATFERRKTPYPEGEPLALTPAFLEASERRSQWNAFLRRARLEGPKDVGTLIRDLRRFLLPVLEAARSERPLDSRWEPGGPWSAK
jgi:hypothetical protein